MSLLLRSARSIRPTAFSASRSLATSVETAADVAVPSSSCSAPTPAPATSASARTPLPTTPPPTPYHPYVHVPLLSLTRSSSAASSPSVVPLPAPLFNSPSRPSLLHKIIIAHLSSLRAGTASTKNRSEVNYSGKKMRPQKGTGGARLGSRGSPMLVGGGRAFGPRPKGPDGWKRKVNRKEEALGLRVALSEKWRTGRLSVVDRLEMGEASTRVLKDKLGGRQWLDALFLAAEGSATISAQAAAFRLSCDNLPGVAYLDQSKELTVYDIVRRRNVVLELSAVDQLIARIDPDGAWVNQQAGEGEEEWELTGEEDALENSEEGFDVDQAARELAEAESDILEAERRA